MFTPIILESEKIRFFGFLKFEIVFNALFYLENHVSFLFQLNLMFRPIIPESEKIQFFGFLTFGCVF